MRDRLTVFLFVAGVVGLTGAATLGAETRGVTVKGKPAAQYVAEQAGKSWAVVIGINEYRDPKIRRLKYAVADAQAVAQELERRGYEVTLLLNQQATRRNIESELRTKLRKRAGADDRVLVYYAGHGQDDKVEGSKTMGYILPVDGELDDIPATGISMGVVKELADALPARQALFLMDACYGGVAGQQTRSLPKMTEAYLKQITRERGRQLITAGGADQEALEASDGGHGLFTAYLLKGLTDGLADLNDDGIIPASELYAYLDSRVFGDAQMRGHQQRPEIWTLSPEKGEFVFFTSARPASSVSPQAGEAKAGVAANTGASFDEMAKMKAELEALKAQMTKPRAEEPKPMDIAKALAYEGGIPPFDVPDPKALHLVFFQAPHIDHRKGMPATVKIAFMDPQDVLEQSRAGRRALNEIKEFAAARQRQINSMETALRSKEERINGAWGLFSDKQALREEFRREYAEYQNKLKVFNDEIQAKQLELTDLYTKRIELSVARVAKSRGYELVLDNGVMKPKATQPMKDFTPEQVKILLRRDYPDVTSAVIQDFDATYE